MKKREIFLVVFTVIAIVFFLYFGYQDTLRQQDMRTHGTDYYVPEAKK